MEEKLFIVPIVIVIQCGLELLFIRKDGKITFVTEKLERSDESYEAAILRGIMQEFNLSSFGGIKIGKSLPSYYSRRNPADPKVMPAHLVIIDKRLAESLVHETETQFLSNPAAIKSEELDEMARVVRDYYYESFAWRTMAMYLVFYVGRLFQTVEKLICFGCLKRIVVHK